MLGLKAFSQVKEVPVETLKTIMGEMQKKDSIIVAAESLIAEKNNVIKVRDGVIAGLNDKVFYIEKRKDAECLSTKSENKVMKDELKQMTKSRNFWRILAISVPTAILGAATYTVFK